MAWLPSVTSDIYAAPVDRSNANDSRTIALELIGPDKRVLEVGCTTGVVSRALREQGCRVVGVEIDPAAADQARQHCESVITGDVEALDLSSVNVGGELFDAALFGDVLEHLKDPLAVLQRVRPLLRPVGFVVASIPNVAHGAVRLALLGGHFDYTPSGLLDGTHLRFFTREAVGALFAEAGFAIAEWRRTVAGLFGTEIVLRPADFAAATIAQIESDPEATTYQFILRAVPEDVASEAVLVDNERERSQHATIRRLSQQVIRLEAAEAASRHELARMRSQWESLMQRPVVRAARAARRLAQVGIATARPRAGGAEDHTPAGEDAPPLLPLPPLPPQDLRESVGDGDFVTAGEEFVSHLIDRAGLLGHHRLLDIGCGAGRMARPLTSYLQTGGYDGFDVDPKAVKWCQATITPRHPNFRFLLADVRSDWYNPSGALAGAEYAFPFPDDCFDVALAASVFTHLPPGDARRYLSESARVLKPGGRLLLTAFLLNPASERALARGSSALAFAEDRFDHRVELHDGRVLAVAYPDHLLRAMLDENGLAVREAHAGAWSGTPGALTYQDLLVATGV